MKMVYAKIVKKILIANNLLFYFYNYIFKNDKVAKGKREFYCAGCSQHHTYPLTSKDYFMCNSCWKTL